MIANKSNRKRPLPLKKVVLCITVAVLVKWPATFVHAAGLGPITLYSRLGESLDAEILLTDVSVADANKLKAYLADEAVFQQSNIERQSVLQHVRMAIVANASNELVVKLSSVRPISEPFVNLIVELAWPAGTFLREYTFLLDPAVQPSTTLSQAPVAEQAPAQAAEPSQTKPQLQSAETSQAQSPYLLLVKRGDNLLEIARQIAPGNISVEQAAIAIYQSNASAFFGSIDQLNAGAELLIPTVATMSELSKSEAVLAVQRSRKKARPVSAKARSAANTDMANVAIAVNEKTLAKDINSAALANALNNVSQEVDTSAIDQQQTNNSIALKAVASQLVAQGSQALPTGSNTAQAVLLENRAEHMSHSSFTELRNIIADLAGALLHLRGNLDEKSNQLAQLSTTLDSLAQKQVATNQHNAAAESIAAQSATAESASSAQVVTGSMAKRVDAPAIASSAIKTLATTTPAAAAAPISTDATTSSVIEPTLVDRTSSAVSELIDSATPQQPTVSLNQSNATDVADTLVALADTAAPEPDGTASMAGKQLSTTQAQLSAKESSETEAGSEAVSTLTAPLVVVKDKANNWLGWFFEESQNRRVASVIRDMGLMFLASLLGFIVAKRMWLRRSDQLAYVEHEYLEPAQDDNEDEGEQVLARHKAPSESFDPLSAIEYFRQQLTSEQHKEEAIRKSLEVNPEDQDARMSLLQLYYDRRAVELYEATAREMYQMTGGKNTHWHQVIELGLSLDTDMQFYIDPKTMDYGDDKFDFDENNSPVIDHAIASVPGGTDDGIESALYTSGINKTAEPVVDEIPLEKPESNESVEQTKNTVQESVDFEVAEFGLHDIDVELDVENLNSTDTASSNGTQDNDLMDLVNAPNTDEQSVVAENVEGSKDASASPWKEAEIKLDLAVVYKDIGNVDGARILLNEVLNSGDGTQVQVARALLSKLR